MDTELFELCKEVVKRTEWGGTDYFYCSGNITHRLQMVEDDCLGEIIPLYTSDYLLEKLPKTYDGNWWLVLEPISDSQWSAGYKDAQLEEWADTPLKALLKLVIALKDAGETLSV